MLEHICMKFVCKFEYDRPNSFRERCDKSYLFFRTKSHVRNNPLKFQIILRRIVKNMGRKGRKARGAPKSDYLGCEKCWRKMIFTDSAKLMCNRALKVTRARIMPNPFKL